MKIIMASNFTSRRWNTTQSYLLNVQGKWVHPFHESCFHFQDFFFLKYLFIWLCQISVEACGIFQLQHMGSNSPIKDRIQPPALEHKILATGSPGNFQDFFMWLIPTSFFFFFKRKGDLLFSNFVKTALFIYGCSGSFIAMPAFL